MRARVWEVLRLVRVTQKKCFFEKEWLSTLLRTHLHFFRALSWILSHAFTQKKFSFVNLTSRSLRIEHIAGECIGDTDSGGISGGISGSGAEIGRDVGGRVDVRAGEGVRPRGAGNGGRAHAGGWGRRGRREKGEPEEEKDPHWERMSVNQADDTSMEPI